MQRSSYPLFYSRSTSPAHSPSPSPPPTFTNTPTPTPFSSATFPFPTQASQLAASAVPVPPNSVVPVAGGGGGGGLGGTSSSCHLIPIRVDLSIDGQRYVDSFSWNLYETSISPLEFATLMVRDTQLPESFAQPVSELIKTKITQTNRILRQGAMAAAKMANRNNALVQQHQANKAAWMKMKKKLMQQSDTEYDDRAQDTQNKHQAILDNQTKNRTLQQHNEISTVNADPSEKQQVILEGVIVEQAIKKNNENKQGSGLAQQETNTVVDVADIKMKHVIPSDLPMRDQNKNREDKHRDNHSHHNPLHSDELIAKQDSIDGTNLKVSNPPVSSEKKMDLEHIKKEPDSEHKHTVDMSDSQQVQETQPQDAARAYQGQHLDGAKEQSQASGSLSLEDLYVPITLNLRIGRTVLQDRFLWDPSDPNNSPEEFAHILVAELGIHREFIPYIANAIREQVPMPYDHYYQQQQEYLLTIRNAKLDAQFRQIASQRKKERMSIEKPVMKYTAVKNTEKHTFDNFGKNREGHQNDVLNGNDPENNGTVGHENGGSLTTQDLLTQNLQAEKCDTDREKETGSTIGVASGAGDGVGDENEDDLDQLCQVLLDNQKFLIRETSKANEWQPHIEILSEEQLERIERKENREARLARRNRGKDLYMPTPSFMGYSQPENELLSNRKKRRR